MKKNAHTRLKTHHVSSPCQRLSLLSGFSGRCHRYLKKDVPMDQTRRLGPFSSSLGNVRGNPGVFLGNPHPHPQEPAPACRGRGFKGFGLWVYQNPRVPRGFVIITLYYYDIIVTTNNNRTNKTN
jgi:hypothetical protein